MPSSDQWMEAVSGEQRVRMTGGEMQTIREYLGLTLDTLASILHVREDTLRKWEAGKDPIPYRIPDEIDRIEALTSDAIDDLVSGINDSPDPYVIVYRTDDDMLAARPEFGHLGARWWRHVAARAAYEVPGLAIIGSHEKER